MAADLERAIEIAYRAHEGQTRLDGRPYVDHPLWVMNALRIAGRSETEQIIGVVHDVPESKPKEWPISRFREKEGYGDDVTVPLRLLTWDKEEVPSYEKYIDLLKKHESARVPKVLDNLHNLIDYPVDREVNDWRTNRVLRYSRSILHLLSPVELSDKVNYKNNPVAREVKEIVAVALDPKVPNKDDLILRVARLAWQVTNHTNEIRIS